MFDEVNGRPQIAFCRLDKNSGDLKISLSTNEYIFSIPPVHTIATHNSEVYIGGEFEESGFYTGRGALLSNTSIVSLRILYPSSAGVKNP